MTEDESDVLDPETYGETELLDRPVDRVTPSFFRDVIEEYVETDRLDRGIARFEIDGDRERCFVVADALADLDEAAYAKAEIAELIAILDADPGILEQSMELAVPVADEDRVREEVAEQGTVTVVLEPAGLRTILENLLGALEHPGAGGSDDSADAETMD